MLLNVGLQAKCSPLIGVAESISGDKLVIGSRINVLSYCACADIIIIKVAENGVTCPK